MASATPPNYSPGLEGVIAGESAISSVDAGAGLLYRGYDIHELAAQSSFEEIVCLLLQGELPTPSQLEKTREDLAAELHLPDPIVSMLRLMPAGAHPIDVLRTGVSMLASFDPALNDSSHETNLKKAMRLIAKIPTLITSGWRIAKGEEPYSPGEHLPYAARFLFSLTGVEPQPHLSSAMNRVLVLYAEHEFNASTFAARVTASTMSDIYAAITTALGTLKGPLHGGANEEAMKMLREIGSPDHAEAWVKDHLARKQKIMGFGHRVYKKGDSRVPAMRELARDLGKRLGEPQWVAICEQLETAVGREKGLCANLDLYAAPALYLMGIPPELNISVFAASRVTGWCAHVIEQHDHNRLIRPRSLYTGPARRAYPPSP
jgi:2-methylcitrate synthase/citrate synthase II